MLRSVLMGLAMAAVGASSHAQAPNPNAAVAAEACFGCHGPSGQGATGGAAIAGRDRADLNATMIAFRNNERAGTIMGRIARGYSDAEIATIADFISRQR